MNPQTQSLQAEFAICLVWTKSQIHLFMPLTFTALLSSVAWCVVFCMSGVVTQHSHRIRCDTACCEGRGGRRERRSSQGLFLKPPRESWLGSARMLRYAARLLTCRALTDRYFISPPPQLQQRTCRVELKERNCSMNIWKIRSGAQRKRGGPTAALVQNCSLWGATKWLTFVPGTQNQFSSLRPTDLYALPPQSEGSGACPELRSSQSIDSSIANNAIQQTKAQTRALFWPSPSSINSSTGKRAHGDMALRTKEQQKCGITLDHYDLPKRSEPAGEMFRNRRISGQWV